ncbi:MAG: 4-hydroxy-tetrahydrodipicolinate reductase [Zetaproteobacteria bacterium]|nr:MAG: 4-hydroxy-tetrahydrodipicolinate reductase [Zetaproteobacteria bacterium]
MGRMVVRAVLGDDAALLVAAGERPGSPCLGADAGTLIGRDACGVALRPELDPSSGFDVVIDFTAPQATLAHAAVAADAGSAMVIGTTGFEPAALEALRARLAGVPVLMAPNFSVGVNLALQLVRRTAALLDAEYDAEIVEAHHRHKVDAPSGTALALGRAVADGRGVALDGYGVFTRHGACGTRPPGAIGFAVVRAGGIVGEHSVRFVSDEEEVEIRHVARDRMVFAKGALRAAHWLRGRPPGWYSMADMLGFTDD